MSYTLFSFDSPENKTMAREVLKEVRSIYGKDKWTKAVIRVSCGFFFYDKQVVRVCFFFPILHYLLGLTFIRAVK